MLSPTPNITADIAKIKKRHYEIALLTYQNLQSIAHNTLVDKLTDASDLNEIVGD